METDSEVWHAREEFLHKGLSDCGWRGETTEEAFNSAPGLSNLYLDWWALKPREIVKKFRIKLRKILLESTNTVKTTKRRPLSFPKIPSGLDSPRKAESSHH